MTWILSMSSCTLTRSLVRVHISGLPVWPSGISIITGAFFSESVVSDGTAAPALQTFRPVYTFSTMDSAGYHFPYKKKKLIWRITHAQGDTC